MAEVESLLQKKLERGSYSERETVTDNFTEDNELTVEITLAEYRSLIKSVAVMNYKIEEANKDKYERNSENTKLKERVKDLEVTLLAYRNKYGWLSTESVSEFEEGV